MLEYLILMTCATTDPYYSQYHQPCISALTAASIQTHLKGNVDILQKNTEKEIARHTSEKFWGIVLTGYGVYSTQKITFTTKFKPFADSLGMAFEKNGVNTVFTWNF